MTLKEVLAELEALGSERMREHNIKHGVTSEQFGVKMGDIRVVAKKAKTDHALGLELWKTGILEARFLAILIMKPNNLSLEEINQMVRSEKYTYVIDWFYSYVIKEHPQKETMRVDWMRSKEPMPARLGWSLTSGRIARDPEGLDLPGLLDRIVSEMATAAPEIQWTMNTALANIGIHFPEHRQRSLEIGEQLGIYRDYPVPKGCTSPFAPLWINEMVKRQTK